MKNITFEQIKDAVSNGLYKACHILNDFTLNHLKLAREKEKNVLVIWGCLVSIVKIWELMSGKDG